MYLKVLSEAPSADIDSRRASKHEGEVAPGCRGVFLSEVAEGLFGLREGRLEEGGIVGGGLETMVWLASKVLQG